MKSLSSIVDMGQQIMKEPERFIEANYGSDLEKQNEREPERIDYEPEEELRKQNVWDMYYGLGH